MPDAVISFYKDGKKACEFGPEYRICFYHRLQGGKKADFKNLDIAVFLLTADANKKLPPSLLEKDIQSVPGPNRRRQRTSGVRKVRKGDSLHCFHFGEEKDEKEPMDVRHSKNDVAIDFEEIEYPRNSLTYAIVLANYETSPGSSGSPVFNQSNQLIGVHFATGMWWLVLQVRVGVCVAFSNSICAVRTT